ncbi:MAG TPA: HTTM domain-containing protein [Polyangiaceae bacterium]
MLRPISSDWLAAFRVLYGLALAVSMLRFIAAGWIDRFFVEPRFHFKYWGFEWVEPLSANGMHALFAVLTGLALCVSAGFAFRITATAFAAGLTYIQLIDVSTYLNHYYLAALLAWLLCISPAHRAWSVDAWLARRLGGKPKEPVRIEAAWLYVFRVQVGLVYFFAGLAKAQGDWLLHAQPLRIWLGANVDLPIFGELFTLSWTPLVLSWCGFLFDTTIVGFLLHRKTRPWAYGVVLVFHAFTRVLFPIGMFPVIMALSALVFFEPDWPRRLVARLRRTAPPRNTSTPKAIEPSLAPSRGQLARLSVLATYCALQVLLPLRSLAYGGNVLWHEQGMRFSWRVMVRAKGGSTTFVVRNKNTGRIWHVNPRTYLTGLQENEMSSQPDLILQLAHHVHDDFVARGLGPVEVKADSRVSLNGRRGARLIDPAVDLVAIRDGLKHAEWILPAPRQAPPHTRPVL